MKKGRLDEHETRWFAVRTRFKAEKSIVAALQKKGITGWLPVRHETKKYNRKIRTSQLPLINCYVFVSIVADNYVQVLETENVVGFVQFANELIDIPDSEMELLRRISGENIPISVEPSQYLKGDLVEITSGNLAGMRGFLMEKQGKHEVVISLENIGFDFRLTVDLEMISRVGF